MAEAVPVHPGRGALRFYQVMAIVTGVFLLLVTLGVILKYLVHVTNATVLDASTIIATTHGFVYMVYLVACGRLWSRARWGWLRLLALAAGGVVPGLSFFLEARVTRELGGGSAS